MRVRRTAEAEKAFGLFLETYEPKYPKATLCLEKDREELLAFYDFPAQHWQSIRTSNPIESRFGTIRASDQAVKGCLTRDGMAAYDVQTGAVRREEVETTTRDYLAKVVTGIKFKDGIEVHDQIAA